MAQICHCIYYKDAQAGMKFLKEAFGFEEVICFPGPDGTISHAEMRIQGSDGGIMLGSEKTDKKRLAPSGACAVAGIYVGGIKDAEALYEQAKVAGAKITMEIMTTFYGSRDFSAEDPEGHTFHFGTYKMGDEIKT